MDPTDRYSPPLTSLYYSSSPNMSSLAKTQSGELDKDSKPSYDQVHLRTSDAPEGEVAHYHGATVSLDHNVNAILQNPLAGIPKVSKCFDRVGNITDTSLHRTSS
jgi:hypothetical protein